MYRYLMLLGIVTIVFSVVGGCIEIANSYSEYQGRLHVSGVADTNPLTVMDEARWQVARLIGGGVIAGGLIAGSMLMGLAWIGNTLEQARDLLTAGQPPSNSSSSD